MMIYFTGEVTIELSCIYVYGNSKENCFISIDENMIINVEIRPGIKIYE